MSVTARTAAMLERALGMLIGDVSANHSVNAADVSLVKSNSGSGLAQANFRSDVNANGAISAADVSLVKSKSGSGLPQF